MRDVNKAQLNGCCSFTLFVIDCYNDCAQA